VVRLTDEARAAIAREIFELTQPLPIAPDEITVRHYVEIARQKGIILTDRQARVALENAVASGTLTRRNIGRNVYYKKVNEQES